MAVQVLSPHHCLKNLPTFPRTPLSPLMIISRPKPNPNNQANIPSQPDFRKQQKPSGGRANNTKTLPAKNRHKIKKRGGEPIKAAAKVSHPSPQQKVRELKFYAGSCASSASPTPSSLPVPSFLAKK